MSSSRVVDVDRGEGRGIGARGITQPTSRWEKTGTREGDDTIEMDSVCPYECLDPDQGKQASSSNDGIDIRRRRHGCPTCNAVVGANADGYKMGWPRGEEAGLRMMNGLMDAARAHISAACCRLLTQQTEAHSG